MFSTDQGSSTSVKKSDEDAPCDICRSKESEPTNEMVFCDVCDICVHQACYGVTEIPKGSWFCKPCQENIRPKCIFCPNINGAKKKTINGNWAHVSCALWIPEVSFGNPETMDSIVNIEKIPKSRWSLTCSLCHVRNGACIQCYVKKCKIAYHVTCAFKFKLHMEMEDVIDSEHEIKFESFCMTHTSLLASGQNPHDAGSSRKRKKTQENLESKGNTQLQQTEVPLEEENHASTSNDTDIPVVPAADKTIEESGNKVQNGNDCSIGAGLFTEEDIVNIASISKGTARKSFALPPKKICTLSNILPKAKTARNTKRPVSDKSKRASVQNGPSNPKKIKQSSPKKTKALIHPNPPMQSSPHEEGKNTMPSEQPSSSHLSNKPRFSGTPSKLPLSNCSDSAVDKRELFPSPNKQTMFNDVPSTSYAQQFLPSAMKQTPTPCQNEQPLSDVTMGFQANPTISAVPETNNLEQFSAYIKSLLRPVPYKKALRIQDKAISLVINEINMSSEEEFVSSCSSEE